VELALLPWYPVRATKKGRSFTGKPGPWNTVLRWIRAISIPNRQFGGRGGKSIETGKGGRSSAVGGLPAAAALGGDVVGGVDGVAVLGGSDNGVAGEGDAADDRLGNIGSDPAPGPGEATVVSVRPRDAATEDAPIPGTVGSIKLAEPEAGLRGTAPEVRLTSVVGRVSGLAAGCAEPGAGPACDNLGSKPAGL
jgi:hypothetical protein